jgi:hypothetical protein
VNIDGDVILTLPYPYLTPIPIPIPVAGGGTPDTRRTQQTHIIGVTTLTSRNEIEVNLVGNTDATSETVFVHGFSTRNWNGGKTGGRAVGMQRVHPRDFKFNRMVELVRHHAVIV